MPEMNKKLERWAEKLLDTGKRNNLINFHDTKLSSAEIVFPIPADVFGRCSVGSIFEVFDPKLRIDEEDEQALDKDNNEQKPKPHSREAYIRRFSESTVGNQVLVYSHAPNPITAVRNIAKKSKQIEDETGINASYLAFGFLRWNEKENSKITYRAPLLLVHTSITAGSVLDPLKIEVGDDDVVVNPTLNYLFQAEFGFSLPEYEDGQTLASYYAQITNLVEHLGWTVLDECKIGIFSFLKMNMYEDLITNGEAILANPNVIALLGGNIDTDSTIFSDVPLHLMNPLVELHTVIDADSSQIEAIEMAKSGKSFVLQGPPGTGKSQTITNIIAELLHDGRKILFVSEKQAALNVVYDKLTKVGLADFCLELHSHKANKKSVIDEINRTLEAPKSQVSTKAEDEIRRKCEAQRKLDSYEHALHERRDVIDMSLYQLFEAYSAQRTHRDISFSFTDIQSKDRNWMLRATELLERYVEYIPSVGTDYRKNAWYGFLDASISFEGQETLKADLIALREGYKRLDSLAGEIQVKYETPDLSLADTARWATLLDFLANSNVVTQELLNKTRLDDAYAVFNQMSELSQSIIPLSEKLSAEFDQTTLDELVGKDLHQRLTDQYGSFFSRLFNQDYKNLVISVQKHRKTGVKLNYQQLLEFSSELEQLQSLNQAFVEAEHRVSGCLGSCYRGPNTDWDIFFTSLQKLGVLLGNETQWLGSFTNISADDFERNRSTFGTEATALNESIREVAVAKERTAALFDVSQLNLNDDAYTACISKLEACLANFDKLGNWRAFIDLLEKIDSFELTPYIHATIDEAMEPPEIVGTFKRCFYRQWIESIMFTVPEISMFTRVAQDQARRMFVEKDAQQYIISRAQIVSELSQRRPNMNLIAGGSALAILRREGRKKRKQMPIRKLLTETGSLIQTVKPCFLMSPLSVSTFLDPNNISFDTIVFDEASQIFPQDAVGAIYRGRQLIVVGDSRQMPPSDFFNASVEIEDDDEAGDINDFESILDICSSVFCTERLSWHYRSHYEQLIAFSNLNFYNNNLITFPSSSADHEDIGVDYYHVDGVFDRMSKTNRAEAEFVADLVFKHFETHPKRSIGVVAFSVAQQGLIDRIISKRRELNPAFEEYFSSSRPEPFFVKNLETVQGDERDTIVFSVAYAPDAQGRFIHNFGPLNREGGERRLNVAITRAKDNVKLVSSISYTDIDLSRTNAMGSRLLRSYLDFAENGEIALERSVSVPSDDQFDSYFEEEVCDFLRDRGFTVDTQIGCSGYRIDMGIRTPNSSNYVLAIECDGATYHSFANTRDRDSLRQRVLENMGWKFYRIWSTDWFKNNAIEKERLLSAVLEALADTNREPSIDKLTSDEEKIESTAIEETQYMTESGDQRPPFEEYRQADAIAAIKRNGGNLQMGILEVLKTEAPLSEELLLKRIVSLFGRKSVTKVVMREYERRMVGCNRRGIVRRNGFLYLNSQNTVDLRVPGIRRDVRQISLEELAAGLKVLIGQNGSVTRDGLYRAMGELLGYKRTGNAIAARFDEALEKLTSQGIVKSDDEMLTIA